MRTIDMRTINRAVEFVLAYALLMFLGFTGVYAYLWAVEDDPVAGLGLCVMVLVEYFAVRMGLVLRVEIYRRRVAAELRE